MRGACNLFPVTLSYALSFCEAGRAMAVVRAIGQPENPSERKALAHLSQQLPDDYLIFHNLELSTPSGLPYEYDMIVVGKYSVCVVEVKGYRGLIRGNAQEWELESG